MSASLEAVRLQSETNSRLLESPHLTNDFNQPVGFSEPNWTGAKYPDTSQRLDGQHVHLVALDVDTQGDLLWDCFQNTPESYYTYLFHGPFKSKEQFKDGLRVLMTTPDQVYYAIYDNTTQLPVGYINLMRVDPKHGCIEVGCVCFSHHLQKNRKGTEVIWLLMQHAFKDLGYRRFEWKCDVNNIPSRRAALRFGFSFEGMFRRHVVYRGRTRDTAWFAIIEDEFENVMVPSYEEYFNAANFDENQVQIKSLPECREPYRTAYDQAAVQDKTAIESPSAKKD